MRILEKKRYQFFSLLFYVLSPDEYFLKIKYVELYCWKEMEVTRKNARKKRSICESDHVDAIMLKYKLRL